MQTNNSNCQMASASQNRQILTTAAYWNSIGESTKSYWQREANRNNGNTKICTTRPSLREFSAHVPYTDYRMITVRRCSTGGKWGKSADRVVLNEALLLASGYIYVTYTPKAQRIAAKREAVYANDNH